MKKNQSMTDLLDIIVEEVDKMQKSEKEGKQKLAKADPGEETPGEKKPEGSSLEGTSDGSAPPAAPTDAPPADATSEAPPEAAPADGSADAEPIGDPAADASAGLTPEAIKAEIGHLPLEQVQMYYLAFKARLSELDPQAAQPEAAPDASAGMPPAAPAPEAPPMGKGEFDDKSGKVSAGSMAKSESLRKAEMDGFRDELAALKKANEEKDQVIAGLTNGVGQVAQKLLQNLQKQQGMRKSVAGITFVGKPGEKKPEEKGAVDFSKMTKSEAISVLRTKAKSTDLKKSDRDLINQITLGQIGFEKAEHLFKAE